MSVVSKIDAELVASMKEHDAYKTSLLRMLKSALKNAEINAGAELTDQEAFVVLEKQAKQRRDAAEQYRLGGRPELAEKELSESDVIVGYLPAKLSEEEITRLVNEKIIELSASSLSDMGKVIGAVVSAADGAADGAMVSRIVKQRLL
jgi:uncharacterized protein